MKHDDTRELGVTAARVGKNAVDEGVASFLRHLALSPERKAKLTVTVEGVQSGDTVVLESAWKAEHKDVDQDRTGPVFFDPRQPELPITQGSSANESE